MNNQKSHSYETWLPLSLSILSRPNVRAVKLPCEDQQTRIGTQCTVIGWGATAWKGKNSWHAIKKVTVPIVDDLGIRLVIRIMPYNVHFLKQCAKRLLCHFHNVHLKSILKVNYVLEM